MTIWHGSLTGHQAAKAWAVDEDFHREHTEGRTEACKVQLEFHEDLSESQTPPQWLAEESPPEERPESLLWGTRESLRRGGRQLLAQASSFNRSQGGGFLNFGMFLVQVPVV